MEQGLQLAGALISSEEEDAKMKNELIYLCCVGKYRLGKYLEAKSQVKELLKVCYLDGQLIFTRANHLGQQPAQVIRPLQDL